LQLAPDTIRLDFSVQSDQLARLELVAKIGSIEPNGFQTISALARGHLKNGHPAGTKQAGGPDFGYDGGHFPGPELGDSTRVQAVFVTEGQIVKKIFDGMNSLCSQSL